MAKRIQRERTKGWRMPDGAIFVGRPTRWGNPFLVGSGRTNAEAVELFRAHVAGMPQLRAAARTDLAGRDLACWCPLDQPCHADVWLEIVN